VSLNRLEAEHLRRLEESLANTYGLANLASWIEEKTILDSRRFSFKNHEFQRTVINDAAQTSIIVKCAQIGLSEIISRWGLGAACTQDDFTIIYTFPTTNDAEKFCKTRIDPTIEASDALKSSVNPNLNNSEIKQFGRNSFIYFRGTLSETAALSVPANAIIHDEVDKSNLEQMSVYVSRLQHKPHKLRKLFSTPTVNRYGISKEAETARRHRQVLRCNRCNHEFLPDYFEHIHIPGFDKPKKEITKATLKDIRWKDATVLCPHCGKTPDLHERHLTWICENSHEAYDANAWFLTPFSAALAIPSPAEIKRYGAAGALAGYLVKNSTEYDKYSEFQNQALGLTAEDENDSITTADLDRSLVASDLVDSGTHQLGADMGMMCHISIGREAPDGELLVVHRESVPYTRFEARRAELCAKYRITISVHDAQPYVDMINRITERDPNAWASVFTTGTPSVLFSIKEQEEDKMEGKLNMRRLNVTRTMAFDNLMADIKAGRVIVAKNSALDETWKSQMQSLKRVAKFDKSKDIFYVWEKTDGQDHYHFSLLYLRLATLLKGMVAGMTAPGAVPLVKSFLLRQR
jgi:hypothetical protein